MTKHRANELTKTNDFTDEITITDGFVTQQNATHNDHINNNEKPSNNSPKLHRTASLSTLDESTLNSTAYLINCTSCFSLNRRRKSLKKSKAIIGNKAKPRIVQSSSASNSGTNGKNHLNKVHKPKKAQTQFLIKFHQFSLRSPFCTNSRKSASSKSSGGGAAGVLATQHSHTSLARINTVNKFNNQNNETGSPMNQRCCLSVSVVPSDKHNAKRRNVRSETPVFHLPDFLCFKASLRLQDYIIQGTVCVLSTKHIIQCLIAFNYVDLCPHTIMIIFFRRI